MDSIANLKLIQRLLETETGYRISKDTGIPQSTISRFVTGETELTKMSLQHAITLTNYYNQLKEQENTETPNDES